MGKRETCGARHCSCARASVIQIGDKVRGKNTHKLYIVTGVEWLSFGDMLHAVSFETGEKHVFPPQAVERVHGVVRIDKEVF